MVCYRRWINLHDEFYPENGWTAEIYTGHINHTHLVSLDTMVNNLQDLADQKLYLKSDFNWKQGRKVQYFLFRCSVLVGQFEGVRRDPD